MHRIIEYIVLFLVILFLQVFLFNNLQIGYFLNPFVYMAFIILLPLHLCGYILLLIAFFTGAVMDFFMGTAGLNVMATVFTTFCRPTVISLFLVKDDIEEGGIPNVNKMGAVKFLNYSFIMALIHSAVFFSVESMSSAGLGYILVKILMNATATFIAVYFTQILFLFKRSKS